MGDPSLGSWFEGSFLGLQDLMILWGEIFWYQLKRMVFICALGSIVMALALVPCLVASWSVVKKAVWPPVALSGSRVPSLGRVELTLSE